MPKPFGSSLGIVIYPGPWGHGIYPLMLSLRSGEAKCPGQLHARGHRGPTLLQNPWVCWGA